MNKKKENRNNQIETFKTDRINNIEQMSHQENIHNISKAFMIETGPHKYTYNFDWLSRPIIQFPQDIIAIQEIIWKTKPDLIIETGIAHGGSLLLSASMLALLDLQDSISNSRVYDHKKTKRQVLGIDIDIRQHNRIEIENHPFSYMIKMLEGSSISLDIVDKVKKFARDFDRVMVCLDSNHTHEHVLSELNNYAGLTSVGCYCIVLDTSIENVPKSLFLDKPWGPGNNPKTAVWEYLKSHPEFEIDKSIENKLLITVAPDGYLKRKI
jgi:cephalosporin hydroxylase